MYYYVVEASPSGAQARITGRIRSYLTELGILGEFALSSPARSVEELTVMGLEKGYTTIVAVGSGRTANKVASVVQSKGVAMGVIPTEEHSPLHEIIGTTDVRSACEVLKFRRVVVTNLMLIEPYKYILTSASIHFVKPYPVELEFPLFSINVAATDIIMGNNLHITIQNRRYGPHPLVRAVKGLFGRTFADQSISSFHEERVRIISPPNAPVIVEHEIVAKTPVVVRLKKNTLQLIVAKKKT